jgi:hypothetical protein
MKPWIAGHLTGGLGNRLFQHAAALGLAEKWGHTPVFYLPQMSPTNHGPFDTIFKLFPHLPLLSEEQSHLLLPEPQGNVFTYTPFQSDPVRANVVIDGWRQTARYFPALGVHAALEKAISSERQNGLLSKYNLHLSRQTTCSLHIRLGDYKVLPHHQIDIGSYVLKASKQFPPGSRFLVFSDEAKAHKEMLEAFVRTLGHEPVVVDEEDELESLFLMSQCWGGAIVANSTFSWWGAYFARQRCPNPSLYKACYPSVWGAGLPAARDVIPPWGTVIPSE